MPRKSKFSKRHYSKKRYSGYTKKATGPNTLIRKLRYTDTIILNAGLAQAANHFISANGIYDPDITGTGHQPLGFDQYMTLYDHYKVLGSKIRITTLPNATDTADTQDNQQIVSIYLDDDLTANFNINNMIEQGQTTYKILGAGSGLKPTTLTKSFSNKTFFSNKKFTNEVVGDVTSNPADQAYYNISTMSLNQSGDPASISVLVVVDYIVQFSERKTLGQS